MNNKLEGITLHAEGEANCYRLMRGGNWLATIRMNGELLVWDQEDILRAMLQGQQAAPVADPDCDRSACGDFSPGPCDNLDCPALRSNKKTPVGEREVVMPERKDDQGAPTVNLHIFREGWNACLDEFARLNKGGSHE